VMLLRTLFVISFVLLVAAAGCSGDSTSSSTSSAPGAAGCHPTPNYAAMPEKDAVVARRLCSGLRRLGIPATAVGAPRSSVAISDLHSTGCGAPASLLITGDSATVARDGFFKFVVAPSSATALACYRQFDSWTSRLGKVEFNAGTGPGSDILYKGLVAYVYVASSEVPPDKPAAANIPGKSQKNLDGSLGGLATGGTSDSSSTSSGTGA
jgi:hypothetical protein